jgi:tRNA(fMet)-specific endonuclease VapC
MQTLSTHVPPGYQARIAAFPPGDLAISAVTVAELEFGILSSCRPVQYRERLNQFLALLVEVPFDRVSAEQHARIRQTLRSAGAQIGPMDLLLAATALAHDAIVVTNNVREFSRVPGLRVENGITSA